MDNQLLTISVEGYEIVNHILTLGYAAMAAALLFFVLTKHSVLPKYRMSSVISVVVMVSAFLLLFVQRVSWTEAFTYTGGGYTMLEGSDRFTNGYRYLNWLIDVPMLLIQILFVAEIMGKDRARYITRFTVSGAAMILLGYVGQFYEPGRTNANITAWAIWGLLSTAFFIHVLILIKQVIVHGTGNMSGTAQKIFAAILPLFYISWWLYPIAYAAPALMSAGVSYELTVVSQQVIYTIADISSKVIYGIMLTITANLLSEQQGFKEA